LASIVIFIQTNNELLKKISQKSIMGFPFDSDRSNFLTFYAEIFGGVLLSFVYTSLVVDRKLKINNNIIEYFNISLGIAFSYFCFWATIGTLSGGGGNPIRTFAPAILMYNLDLF